MAANTSSHSQFGALDRALADSPRYSMAQLLREALDPGAPPAIARLPMTPEEVAAAYDAAEAAEGGAKAAVPAGEAGESDFPRPDTLPEPFAWQGAVLAPFVHRCASLSGIREKIRRGVVHAELRRST
jgi:hypothetical protein